MRPILAFLLVLALPVQAKRPAPPTVATVPSIEAVVAAEGFTPTPSQSEIYRPGAVLVPNGRGGHDVVVEACIDAEPSVSIMSQSSIATTLAGGVSARLGMVRGAASAGVEKRLSFVDPEQRTLPLGDLVPTQACLASVARAATLQDLSQAIVLHDVLVAIIKNTVCTKADASGGMVALGSVEASAFSECVQESDGQVPLGYKAVPLSKVQAMSGGAVPIDIGPVTERGEAEVEVGGDVDFAELARRAAQAKAVREAKEEALVAEQARLEAQERTAAAALAEAQRARSAAARQQLLDQAAADLRQLQPLLEMALSPETKPVLEAYIDKWGSAKVHVDDLTEDVDVPGVAVVRTHLGGPAYIEWIKLNDFSVSKSEVTVAQYRVCVKAGACSPPDTGKYCNWGRSGREDHPINCVDYQQATTFAAWAGARLPTGDEWKAAAYGGGKYIPFPWGEEAPTCERVVMDEGGWGCGRDSTWPVCSKPAGNSKQGVCDLSGSLFEWTREPGLNSGSTRTRMCRGGGWNRSKPRMLNTVTQFAMPVPTRGLHVGIRLVK